MLETIKSFFSQQLTLDNSPAKSQLQTMQIATAALLIEVMMTDDNAHHAEINTIINSLQKMFSLSVEQTNELVVLAKQELGDATDYYQFTSLIHKQFPLEKKLAILELLWRVAYADGKLDAYEEHLIRRIADLLYISHSDYIATKLRAEVTAM